MLEGIKGKRSGKGGSRERDDKGRRSRMNIAL